MNYRKLIRLLLFQSNRYILIKILILFLIILFTFIFILSDKLFSTQFLSNDLWISSEKHLINEKKAIREETNEAINEAIIDAKSHYKMETLNTNYNYLSINSEESRKAVYNRSIIRFGGFDYKTMKIAITVCGEERLKQSLITLKSAVILTQSRLHFIIMSDEQNIRKISQTILNEWPNNILKRISFEIHSVSFPNAVNVEEWKKLFKLCAAQRLFLPTILSNIDSVIYVDTDVLFLTPVDHIWSFFHRMNSSQMAGMSPESEDFASSWYYRFAKHPYVERLGVNSGVMLMNLTRMRDFGWNNYLEPYLSQYRKNIVWGDQDIINIIFHFNSDKLYIFGCNWNYRPDHCIYTRVCKEAEKHGISILHGNRGVFLNGKQPAFRAIYQAFQEFDFNTDLLQLLNSMSSLLDQTLHTNCGKAKHTFLKALTRLVEN